MNEFRLPDSYVPYRFLDLCSNKLIDVRVPISVDEYPAFLLGRNSHPLAWLSAPVRPTGHHWIFVVEAGKSRSRAVDVIADEASKSVSVKVGDADVLHAVQMDEERAVVDLIDLRPLGLNVHGTSDRLVVGGTTLAGNTFQNLRTAVVIGQDKRAESR